jgi:hypothetical protein
MISDEFNKFNKAVSEAIKDRRLDEVIENAWNEVKKHRSDDVFWDETELVLPFYYYLRPRISRLSEDFESRNICLRIIPEYSPHIPKDRPDEDRYPLRNGTEDFRDKVDIAIVAFESHSFYSKKDPDRRTYWRIMHEPVVLLEFKVLIKKSLLKKGNMGADIEKMRKIEQTYRGVRRTYFCYLSDERVQLSDMEKIPLPSSLSVCHGTWKRDWEVELVTT